MCNGIHETSQSRFSDEITLCENRDIKTYQKETQASTSRKSRGRTISELNTYHKSQDNREPVMISMSRTPDTSNAHRGFWGDVYNDYKQTSTMAKGPQKIQRTISARMTKVNSKATSDSVLNGDDVTKRSVDRLINRNPYKNTKSIFVSHRNSEVSKSTEKYSISEAKISVDDEKVQNLQFQKCFQVQPIDELVKSYLTLSDRRVRAVCSRMKCRIRMFGPLARSPSETRSLCQSSGRERALYHLIISSNTKDRLDKSLKCIQETFPKSCLQEKTIVKQNLENYGEEIPL